VCRLLVRIDGTQDCGQVLELPRMAAELKRLAKLRAREITLLKELDRIAIEAEAILARGENDI
jgi:hypothetical protein